MDGSTDWVSGCRSPTQKKDERKFLSPVQIEFSVGVEDPNSRKTVEGLPFSDLKEVRVKGLDILPLLWLLILLIYPKV